MSVYLVGAGTGRDLITVKGLKLLRQADCVIYDSLIDESLLSEIRSSAEKIYVGKRCGKPSAKQEEINDLLVEKGKACRLVVRLKGGDPFVFGRGGEEVLALKRAHIPFEIVAGVSSALSAPESAGIALTHRDVSRSFHVMTASSSDGKLNRDIAALGNVSGTLVFLMGLNRLGEIVETLIRNGRDKETPCAVVSNATRENQRVVRAALCDIEEKAREQNLPSPCVIVAGDAVGYDFSPDVPYRVAVTGTKEFAEKVLFLLGNKGIDCSFFETERAPARFSDLEAYSWIAFASRNGVKYFFENWREEGLDVRSLSRIKIACIGASTAECLYEYGIRADFIPSEADGGTLIKELPASETDKILLCLGEERSSLESLKNAEKRVVYRMKVNEEKKASAVEKMKNADYVAFASASAVKEVMKDFSPQGQKFVCIGKATKSALALFGYDGLVCERADAESLVEAAEKDFFSRRNG